MYHPKSFWSCKFWSQGRGMTSELWHHQCMVSNLCLWKANIHIFICTLYHSLWEVILKQMWESGKNYVFWANVWWEQHPAGKETHPGMFLQQGLSSQPPWFDFWFCHFPWCFREMEVTECLAHSISSDVPVDFSLSHHSLPAMYPGIHLH